VRLARREDRGPSAAKCPTVGHFTIAVAVIIIAAHAPALAGPVACSTWQSVTTCTE
jgi:hypothetical protein